MLAASGSALGRHQAHLVVLAVWFAVVVAVLVIDHVRERRRNPVETVDAVSPVPTGPVSMATWPPRRAAVAPRPERVRHTDPTPLQPSPLQPWLALVVGCSLVAAGVHLWVMPEHFRESWLYGTFFLVAASAQAGFALLVGLRPKRTLLRAGAAGNAAVVLLWAYTRLVAVPIGPGRGGTEEVGLLDIFATTAELLVVAGCTFALLKLRQSRPASRVTPRHPVGATVAR